MPYISQSERDLVEDDGYLIPQDAGGLCYVISSICGGYVRVKGLNYATLNGVLGALEGAKLEFYRRVVVPYEEQKLKENGDVY